MIFTAGVAGGGGGITLGAIFIALITIVMCVIGIGLMIYIFSRSALLFNDMGYAWWKAYLPFYNVYLLFKMANLSWIFGIWLLTAIIGGADIGRYGENSVVSLIILGCNFGAGICLSLFAPALGKGSRNHNIISVLYETTVPMLISLACIFVPMWSIMQG